MEKKLIALKTSGQKELQIFRTTNDDLKIRIIEGNNVSEIDVEQGEAIQMIKDLYKEMNVKLFENEMNKIEKSILSNHDAEF